MSNLTPDLYNAGSLGAAGYGVAAYTEQCGSLSVNPSAYNSCSGGDASLASKAIVGGGRKRKSGKSKKAKKVKKAKKTRKTRKTRKAKKARKSRKSN
jgi:hypothetical protein